MKKQKKQTFDAELLMGHKGAGVHVPFDPEEVWGIPPGPIASKVYGRRPGHLVEGLMNGHPFEGWIGHRWGRYFLLVDEDLQDAAGVAVGDTFSVALVPRKKTAARAEKER